MELDNPLFIIVTQTFIMGGLAMGLSGIHQIHEGDRAGGRILLVVGALTLLLFGYLVSSAGGWVDFVLIVGLPTLVSLPAYWLYRSRERSRVFIWLAFALWLGLGTLGISVDAALESEGVTGYWSLVVSALVSSLVVYGYRKLIIRNLTLSPSERQRAARDPWGTIGAAIGLTVGGAILRMVMEKLVPELRAAVSAFLIGLLAFSILGCAGWQFLWEIKRRGQ